MSQLAHSSCIKMEKILENDRFDINGLTNFQSGKSLTLIAHHADGSSHEIMVNHTCNQNQIDWFKAGSALNGIAEALQPS